MNGWRLFSFILPQAESQNDLDKFRNLNFFNDFHDQYSFNLTTQMEIHVKTSTSP